MSRPAPLPPEVIVAYSRRSDLWGGLDCGLRWGLIVAAIAVAHGSGHWAVYVVAAFVIAGLQNGLNALAHEAWHRKAFCGRWLNDQVGAWLYSYAIGNPYIADRKRHLAHHRLVGLRDDPDWLSYADSRFHELGATLRFFGGHLFGSKLALRLLGGASAGLVPSARDVAIGRSATGELAQVAVAQGVLFLCFAVFLHWWEYFVLWVLPLVTLAGMFVSLRAFLEHSHPDRDATGEARLFDFSPTPWERFFIAPCHFYLHALHHAYPSVPHYRLRVFREELARARLTYPVTAKGSYLRTLREHSAGL